ncbi:MAG: hypothetical protein R2792_02835 [Saprospiraceae bacterium]
MRHLSFATLCFLLASLVVSSCGSDEVNYAENLIGTWQLTSASRNDVPTETLVGTWFEFTDGQVLRTNLPMGSEDGFSYEITKNKIHQKSPMEVVYEIQFLLEDTLVLEMESRGVVFELGFIRGEQAPVNNTAPVEGTESINPTEPTEIIDSE